MSERQRIDVGDIVERGTDRSHRTMIYEVTRIEAEAAARAKNGRNLDLYCLRLVFAEPPLESHRFRKDPDWATFISADVLEGLVLVPAMEFIALMLDAGPPVVKKRCPRWCWREHDHGWS